MNVLVFSLIMLVSGCIGRVTPPFLWTGTVFNLCVHMTQCTERYDWFSLVGALHWVPAKTAVRDM